MSHTGGETDKSSIWECDNTCCTNNERKLTVTVMAVVAIVIAAAVQLIKYPVLVAQICSTCNKNSISSVQYS